MNCSGYDMRMTETEACRVDLGEVVNKCGADFGYPEGKPCILLKLNKVRLAAGLFLIQRLVQQRPWYVLSCLWDGAYKRTLAAIRKE